MERNEELLSGAPLPNESCAQNMLSLDIGRLKVFWRLEEGRRRFDVTRQWQALQRAVLLDAEVGQNRVLNLFLGEHLLLSPQPAVRGGRSRDSSGPLECVLLEQKCNLLIGFLCSLEADGDL